MPLFGHYLTERGLQAIQKYKYQGGAYTNLDVIMDKFWNQCVKLVPMWVAPNLLSLLGFIFTWIAFYLTNHYAPHWIEPVPSWACFATAFCIFAHQTVDALDGKQARRTGTMSPLGALFDHGCDIFSATLVAMAIVAVCGTGDGFLPFALVVVSAQMTQFLYLWWEYHFYVFFSNPGYGAGVTEAQMGSILLAILTGVFGNKLWAIDLLQPLRHTTLGHLWRIGTGLEGLKLKHLLLVGVVVNNLAASSWLVVAGLMKIEPKRRLKAATQLASFFSFVCVEWLFYRATINLVGVVPPMVVHLIILGAYAMICIRILLSSTSQRYYHSLQWPASPFCAATVWLYSYRRLMSQQVIRWTERNLRYILLAVLVWEVIYLTDLLYTAMCDMTQHLGVQCFTIKQASNTRGKETSPPAGGGGSKDTPPPPTERPKSSTSRPTKRRPRSVSARRKR